MKDEENNQKLLLLYFQRRVVQNGVNIAYAIA